MITRRSAMHWESGSLSVLILTLQLVDLAMSGSLEYSEDISKLRLLQEQSQQDDLVLLHMQMMQMNLLHLLVGLCIFIVICIYYFGRKEKYCREQTV